VATGLRRTRIATRPGVAALAEVAGVAATGITADRVAFAMAPRLNAAGRMADPRIALRLLMAPDLAAAEPLAAELDRLNRERQSVEAGLLEEAEAQAIETLRDGDRALVLAGEGWHDGVKGIVASRLVGRYGLPTVLFCLDGDQARGSGRSVADVDLFEAVSACSDLLGRYGGHKQAVGVSLDASDLPAFRTRLAEALETLPDEAFSVRRPLDDELTMAEVTPAFVRELRALEPHGLGNPKPLFVAPAIVMRNAACVGREANHLRFEAEDGTSSVKAISFRCDDIEDRLTHDGAVGIVFEVEPDDYRGRDGVQLLVRDFVKPE
jgi:single-stranded-DNA-specific exonuclease